MKLYFVRVIRDRDTIFDFEYRTEQLRDKKVRRLKKDLRESHRLAIGIREFNGQEFIEIKGETEYER